MAGFTHPSRPTQKLSGDFWKFWLGQTISNLGSSFTGFALPLIVFKLTGSALNLAISSATSMLPLLLPALVLLDALSFLLSAGSLALLRTSFNPSGSLPPPGLRHAVAEGLAYVLRHPVLGPVTAMAALVVLVSSPVGSQLVLFAKE